MHYVLEYEAGGLDILRTYMNDDEDEWQRELGECALLITLAIALGKLCSLRDG